MNRSCHRPIKEFARSKFYDLQKAVAHNVEVGCFIDSVVNK